MIQETTSKRPIDLSRAWDSCFLPGQKVDMSMIFICQDIPGSSCPSCKTKCESSEDEDVECPHCSLSFRRVTQASDAIVTGPVVSRPIETTEASSETVSRPLKRKRVDDSSDEVQDYRRIRVIGKRLHMSMGSPRKFHRMDQATRTSEESNVDEIDTVTVPSGFRHWTTIKCICGLGCEVGHTVQCETCRTWQHLICYYRNVYSTGDVSNHKCQACSPRVVLNPMQKVAQAVEQTPNRPVAEVDFNNHPFKDNPWPDDKQQVVRKRRRFSRESPIWR